MKSATLPTSSFDQLKEHNAHCAFFRSASAHPTPGAQRAPDTRCSTGVQRSLTTSFIDERVNWLNARKSELAQHHSFNATTHDGFPVFVTAQHVHTRLYEDNSGAIEIMKVPEVRSRTKHLNVKYHHYREAVRKHLLLLTALFGACVAADASDVPGTNCSRTITAIVGI